MKSSKPFRKRTPGQTELPAPEELKASVAALNEAYADFQQGDRGEPARENLRKVCGELGLVIDP